MIQLGSSEWGTIEPQVVLDGRNGEVKLARAGGNIASIRLVPEQSSVDLMDTSGDQAVRLSAESPDTSVGAKSSVQLDSDDGRVQLFAPASDASVVGGVGLYHNSRGDETIHLRGEEATIALGFARYEPAAGGGGNYDDDGVGPPVSLPAVSGKSGAIILHDGTPDAPFIPRDPFVATITADQGRLLITEPNASKPLFVLDSQSKSLKLRQGWSVDTVL